MNDTVGSMLSNDGSKRYLIKETSVFIQEKRFRRLNFSREQDDQPKISAIICYIISISEELFQQITRRILYRQLELGETSLRSSYIISENYLFIDEVTRSFLKNFRYTTEQLILSL